MNSSDPAYFRFRAFIDCTGREATHAVNPDRGASPTVAGKLCYTRENSNLLLCDACLAFWRECIENESQAMWEMAVFLRDQRGPDAPPKSRR
jgi:hypothetical protein